MNYPKGKPALQTADNESGHFRTVSNSSAEREINRRHNKALLDSRNPPNIAMTFCAACADYHEIFEGRCVKCWASEARDLLKIVRKQNGEDHPLHRRIGELTRELRELKEASALTTPIS